MDETPQEKTNWMPYLLVGCGCLTALIGGMAVAIIAGLTVVGNEMNTLFSEVASELEEDGDSL